MREENIIPLLTGDYPDPTVVQYNGRFYMTHTASQPLIWESEDLLHWTPFCRATDAFSWIAAPELNRNGDQLYLFIPANGTNYVLRSRDMLHWSEPEDLHVGSIDPGYICDRESGKEYLHIAGGRMAELCAGAQGCGEVMFRGFDYTPA